MVNMVGLCAQFRARWGFSIIMYMANGLGSEQLDCVLLCALQWNLSIVVTPGTAKNVLISEVPSF